MIAQNMSLIHTLPLFYPPAPISYVQRQVISPATIFCLSKASVQAAPLVKQQRPPESLEDYVGPMYVFVPLVTGCVYVSRKRKM